MHKSGPVLVAIDAGATSSVGLAVTVAGVRVGRATGVGANPKRHGLAGATDRIAGLVRRASGGTGPALVFVAGAGIDRPQHALAFETALAEQLPRTRIIVVNDTLAALRAATPDAVGIAVPVSTGANVVGRGRDGRVTDRGHGIFGGGYVLGVLAARAARAGRVRRLEPRAGEGRDPAVADHAATDRTATDHEWAVHALPREAARHAFIGHRLAGEVEAASLGWSGPRRPAPEVAGLGAAVARAARDGDPYPARMVDRWCRRVTEAVREEVERLALGDAPAVVIYGGLADAVPWLAARIADAVREGAPQARLLALDRDPVEGAVALAIDAWQGAPIGWAFTPRR